MVSSVTSRAVENAPMDTGRKGLRSQFNKLPSVRSGIWRKLKFNKTKKTLHVLFTGDSDVRAVEKSELVSGGQKTWAQMAFLLSLYRVLECLFSVMDGFDVSLDYENRILLLEGLLGQGRMAKNKQFIFVTPHDINSLSQYFPEIQCLDFSHAAAK